MPSISDIVDAIFPSDEAEGVVLGAEIYVLFDQEIDESSVENGGIFLTGPDTDTWSGPDLSAWERPAGHILSGSEDNILQSPGYEGVVQGTWRFDRIDLSDVTSGVNTLDVTGDGSLFRTKAVFIPDVTLFPGTTYTLYIAGDEDDTDDVETGVRPRTVFDWEHVGAGSENIEFTGTYNGSFTTDIYNITVLTTGVKRTATFEWYLTSSPTNVHGPVLTDAKVFLNNGVFVEFGAGTFEAGDEYTVVVTKTSPFTDTMITTFSTGSGSVVELPDDISTTAIGDLVPKTSVIGDFALTELTPDDRATNQLLTTHRIELCFNADVDPATVTSERVKVTGSPVNGCEDMFATREIYKDITVSGQKILIDF